MGKHKHKDKSRSRSRSRSRSHKRSKHRRDDSSSRSRSRHDRSRSRERRSRFDQDPSGQRVPRKSKWSDKPPDSSASVYDPNAAKAAAQSLVNAITINPELQNAQNELQNKQAELFSSLLSKAKFEAAETRVETYRPALDPFGVPGISSAIVGGLGDATKIKKKIYMPKNSNFNYAGLIIGPKGTNQKRLEEETGCKIIIRGKGPQLDTHSPKPHSNDDDDNEEQHVLIVGDNELMIAKATAEIERILFADEETRNKIRQEQLKLVAKLKNDPSVLASQGLALPNGDVDLSMTTPYGPPSADAYIIPVPNDCVGLVIGKGGETIKQLQIQSGAKKVQVAADSTKGSNTRNVFVEGDQEAYERVKQMIQEIVDQQRKLRLAMTGVLPDNTQGIREEVPVPDNLVGLIIGRGGETIKGIYQKTGAAVFIPKECEPGRTERVLVVSGTPEQVEQAKAEIIAKVQEGIRNLQFKALQASGIPVHLMNGVGFGDPTYYLQFMSSFDPAYAAMYQQMYAQQPEVTTVTDSATLPGQTSYQSANTVDYQQQQMAFLQQQQYMMSMGMGGMDPQQMMAGQFGMQGQMPMMGGQVDMAQMGQQQQQQQGMQFNQGQTQNQ